MHNQLWIIKELNFTDLVVKLSLLNYKYSLTSYWYRIADATYIQTPHISTNHTHLYNKYINAELHNTQLKSLLSSGDFNGQHRATLTSDECFCKCCMWFNMCVKVDIARYQPWNRRNSERSIRPISNNKMSRPYCIKQINAATT